MKHIDLGSSFPGIKGNMGNATEGSIVSSAASGEGEA
jgi:hypothetical protein